MEVKIKSEWRKYVAQKIEEVIDELNEQGVNKFTVRQLFYQLVVRKVLKLTKQDYKNFDSLFVRLREKYDWMDEQVIDTSKPRYNYYKESFWAGQKYFPEIWIEKDALRAFFEPFAKRYRINLVVCRGYPSITRLREAKEARHVPEKVQYVILYFGDFDPSGQDIFRWINEELKPYYIKVMKIALTEEQVKMYKLPPMIPKKSDPRYENFVHEYGKVAVELDALHPAILREIIRKSILKIMDIYKRLEVEVGEGIEEEAEVIVEEAIRDLKRKLRMIAITTIRNRINAILPRIHSQLLKDIEKGNELNLSKLYNRQEIVENIKNELRKILI